MAGRNWRNVMDQTVCIFPKNKFQEIHIGIREFKSNDLVDIRIWTVSQGADQMVPTAKGVTINVQLLPQLLKALQDTEKILKDNKMLVS
jgi:Transcriptional Coactivator p15 (PC4)